MASPDCLPLQTFHLLGKKDFVPILEEFYFSRFQGFNVLTRQLGITPRQLSTRLSEMVSIFLIEKSGDEYILTPKGKELGGLIQQIKDYHSRHHEGYDSCSGTPCVSCMGRSPAFPNEKRVSIQIPPEINR
jgi:DNA-binding HxlR family transcriptional regulator